MSNRCLFMDMNAFFASVEQQERPDLRGRPIIVAPVLADSTCAIAASYEAKALGIKTGTSVRTARQICPEIAVIEARPKVYVQYHNRILEALNDCFATIKVLSVDEMVCRIGHIYNSTEAEIALAGRVKAQIRQRVGNTMRCSIGVGPNVFLSKVAADRQKPDGLTIFNDTNLPDALFDLDLLDLPGIGPRVLARLDRSRVHTVRQLYHASPEDLRRAWGSVVGTRWHYMLRGRNDIDYNPVMDGPRKSVGHSHVLPPEYRTLPGARQILLRLFSKALKRLRSYGQAAGGVSVWMQFRDEKTYATHYAKRRSAKHRHANDDRTWMGIVRPLIESLQPPKPGYTPSQAGIVFTDLNACRDLNLALFDDPMERTHLSNIVDALNAEHGYVIDLASVWWLRDQAPQRITFGRLE